MNIFILLLFLTLVITPIMNWAQDVYKIISTDKFQTLQSLPATSEVRVGKPESQSPSQIYSPEPVWASLQLPARLSQIQAVWCWPLSPGTIPGQLTCSRGSGDLLPGLPRGAGTFQW